MNRMTLQSGEFYGNTRICRAVPDFKLLDVSYEAGSRFPKHSHQCAFFSVMLRGAMVINYGRQTLDVNPSAVAFNAADQQHWNAIPSGGARFLILEVAADLLTRVDGHEPFFSDSTIFNSGELAWLGTRLYREGLQDDAVSPIAIEGLGLEMVAALFRLNDQPKGGLPKWFVQAGELIHDQFIEPLSVSDIANRVDVHPVHLARTFRKHFGCSIGDYIRKLRVERACHQLSSTRLSLAEIAVQAGFYDQGHLTRIFKRLTGTTPGRYRTQFSKLPVTKTDRARSASDTDDS